MTLQIIKGILDDAQKKRLLERLTDVLVEVEGNGDPAFRKDVWVKIEEQEPNHWMTAELIARKFGAIGPDSVRT
jgi:4-oxalocrotonate tautomerase